MTKFVLIYGCLTALIIALANTILLLTAGDSVNHATMEWLGYLIMIVALSMVFLGIQQYKVKVLGGVIKFSEAFKIGLLITLLASVLYVFVWEIYMTQAGDSFIDDYQSSKLETFKKSGATEPEIKDMKEEFAKFKEIYQNRFYRMLITFIEIFPVGLIIVLISSLLLRNRKEKTT